MTIYFGSSTDEDLIAELEQRGYFCAKAQEPLSDAQINEIRLVHGVTSSGRGIREVAQVISFARAIEAAIKEQK